MKTRVRTRGIPLDPRWKDFPVFFQDMGEAPPNTVLDRIDNTKGYSPENCRWATYHTSTENRRNTIWLNVNGEQIRVLEFARRFRIKESTVYRRLSKGWPIERLGEPEREKAVSDSRKRVL